MHELLETVKTCGPASTNVNELIKKKLIDVDHMWPNPLMFGGPPWLVRVQMEVC
jgi:hypothetical protein